MYKVQLYCSGCRKVIDDREYNKSKILTIEKLNYGPWLDMRTSLNGLVELKVGICQECFKKIDNTLNNNLSKCIEADVMNYYKSDVDAIKEVFDENTNS